MKKSIFPICTILLLIFSSCSSTKIVSSWRETDMQVNMDKLNKVLIVALFKNETSRRKAEDEMITYLKDKGVASYSYLDSDFNKKNESAIRDKIKTDGFDGAVTMRLVDIDKEKVYVPSNVASYPDYYRNFNGYYYRSFSNYYSSGYYTTTRTFTVETTVYSVKEDKIIWSSLTETTDPEGLKNMTDEISKVVYKRMISERFISEQ